jgi:hypothetical protein
MRAIPMAIAASAAVLSAGVLTSSRVEAVGLEASAATRGGRDC